MILARLICLFALVLVTSAAVIDGRAPQKPNKPTKAKPSQQAQPPQQSKPPKPAQNVSPTLVFDCQLMPEVCNNMCYGVNCLNYDSRMYWDKLAAGTLGVKEARKRRSGSGCLRTGGNRCGKAPYGKLFECDEFPFASVEPVTSAQPFNRCVPKEHNQQQGGAMVNFYYYVSDGLKKQPQWFEIGFKNYNGIQYCAAKPKLNCKNDGNEMFKDGSLAKRDLVARSNSLSSDGPHQHYITKRGSNLFMPSGAEIHDVVYSPRSLDGEDEQQFHLDKIVARGNATTFED